MGCEALGERPSMVTILSPAFRVPSGIEQERCSSPLMCTEQAPHWATPQPNLVPVRPTCSRMTHRSGVSGSTCTSRVLPLIFNFAMGVSLPAFLDGYFMRPKRDLKLALGLA